MCVLGYFHAGGILKQLRFGFICHLAGVCAVIECQCQICLRHLGSQEILWALRHSSVKWSFSMSWDSTIQT